MKKRKIVPVDFLTESENLFLTNLGIQAILEPEIELYDNGHIVFETLEEMKHYIKVLRKRNKR